MVGRLAAHAYLLLALGNPDANPIFDRRGLGQCRPEPGSMAGASPSPMPASAGVVRRRDRLAGGWVSDRSPASQRAPTASHATSAGTQILAEERQDMVLKAVSHRAGMRTAIDLEGIGDPVIIKNLVQLACAGA